MSWFSLTERIDEIRDKFGGFGFFLDGFFLVFYDDFVVGHFGDFATRDDELGIEEAFHQRTFHDDLLKSKIVGSDGVVDNFAEFGAFFGLDFETV